MEARKCINKQTEVTLEICLGNQRYQFSTPQGTINHSRYKACPPPSSLEPTSTSQAFSKLVVCGCPAGEDCIRRWCRCCLQGWLCCFRLIKASWECVLPRGNTWVLKALLGSCCVGLWRFDFFPWKQWAPECWCCEGKEPLWPWAVLLFVPGSGAEHFQWGSHASVLHAEPSLRTPTPALSRGLFTHRADRSCAGTVLTQTQSSLYLSSHCLLQPG